MLHLAENSIVAHGKQRVVYLHPHDEEKLIKVLRPSAEKIGRSAFTSKTENLLPYLRIRAIRKEYMEYLRVMLKNRQPEFHLPISHMYGFVSTNVGLGCITEKITSRNLNLATTLQQIIDHGDLTDWHLRMLNGTIKRIFDINIRASDLTAANLVFGHRDRGFGRDKQECVLVDGFGDIHAIPVRSMGRWSNRLGLHDSCKRLARNNGLLWNPDAREFSLRHRSGAQSVNCHGTTGPEISPPR